ncbi:MAG: phosphatase [Oscillospiraceae bacterium]|jgi:putative hydrolase|nr:phosphatase [Oscillospiraceae bacterium]
MGIIADTHCHTIVSGHAYSSLLEMVLSAAKQNLWAIAITDHGRSTPNSPGPWYFENLSTGVPNIVEKVRVLKGIEANVWDYDGNLDASNMLLSSLDWVVSSMHPETLQVVDDIDACTNAWLNVAKNPYVNVIGHSGDHRYKYDYEKVIPEFGKNGKLVEINNGSFKVRKRSIENCIKIAIVCRDYKVPVILNSDAHFSTQVGDVGLAEKLLKEINFPEELIVNSNLERFKKYLSEYTSFLF